MDCGVQTEEVLAEMSVSDLSVRYLVGTLKGRLNSFEKQLLDKLWRKEREGVEVSSWLRTKNSTSWLRARIE